NPEVFKVDIPMTSKDGSDFNYDVHIYPKNETIRGAVELLKMDGEDDGNPLEGVTFELYDSNGEKIGDSYTTDSQGIIQVDGLAYGDYYFKEVATQDGYVLGDQRVEFSIEESGSFDCPSPQKPVPMGYG